MSPVRPLLRWHGGKWLLAPWIISHFPAHRIYVEPFGGAASVLLRKGRSQAEVYNDLDGAVVGLFRVLQDRDQAADLIRRLELTPFARAEFAQAYEPSGDPVEAARRLIIRSFMGFGSNGHQRKTGFRCNGIRAGTLPQHDWAGYPAALRLVIDRFSAVVIENRDALAVMAQQDSADTLHYVDPPYVLDARGDKARDYAHEMDDAAHHELLTTLCDLKGMVVLSGYHHAIYDEALAGWKRVERKTCADGARERTECLWVNRAVIERSGVGPLFDQMADAA
jgi:DNA adenine methylase